MPSVTRPRTRTGRFYGQRPATADGGVPEDPDDLIDLGEAVQLAFERLANEAADNVMRNVYHEMAEAYRRANMDVGRRWRDVTG